MALRSNANLIRWMHVTPWRQDIESLDRLGLMMAMPAGDAEGDVDGHQWQERLDLMRDAIIYNKNSPSIFFYESGNHGITEQHMQDMKDIRDTYDPYGGRAAGSREMLNSSIAEYGGEMLYINKALDTPLWQMEYSRDEGIRKYWDNFTAPYHQDQSYALEWDRNQDSHAVENVVRWNEYYQQRPGRGLRCNAGGVNIIFSDSNTHYRGSQNYRTSGEVDAMRLPKDGYYAHQVMWDKWVDIERPTAHIIGHWNYNTSTVKDVYVVSTADRVELKLNGKSLGNGTQSDRFLFTFPQVQWASGEIAAYGYNATSGKSITSDRKSTTGQSASIRLFANTSPLGFRASGTDVALIDVEVVDSAGIRVPTALDTITFSLSGEAEWRGGIAVGRSDNYILSKTLPVENGVNRFSGLASASLVLQSTPFLSSNVLSLELPSNGLPSDLSRGPTPLGASYTVSRKTLTVSSVIAGSSEDTAEETYDDDETTIWRSNSSTSTAWIRYQLAASATVNAVNIKFRSFKSTHAISVSVDDTVVWSGRSTAGLGYWTAEFNATEGSTVQINSLSGALEITEAELYGPI
ncbi:hypothetical protein PFICI_02987 [Pestalotiopsis fici W106-1]|uniref:F5/8 type C domain-containing protein n=1 Tax=Pestalotiopsis fici (strain W106-1 / CGMCC3.15140) TaxID=1229662 RepID=W3XHP2_PESFW|nr:uncharacterized protein PFICI_02987 [Pestalotiopsis fici W106-1]ETS84962.1 hypothetical protein PFICI_02987 [Pestalotiopsis fici W106-1]